MLHLLHSPVTCHTSNALHIIIVLPHQHTPIHDTCHITNTRQIPVTCHVTPAVSPITPTNANTRQFLVTCHVTPPSFLCHIHMYYQHAYNSCHLSCYTSFIPLSHSYVLPTRVKFLSPVMLHLHHSSVTFHTTNTRKIPVNCHVTPPSFPCHISYYKYA
jgi:hypothetical protein